MKKIFSQILFPVFVVFAFLAAQTAHAAAVATIEEIQGEVSLHAAAVAPDAWQAVSQNTAVNNGDSVKTVNGSCKLVYANQAAFRIEPNTNITIQEKTDTQDILLNLGKLKASVNKDKVVKPFQVVTPTAVGAVRGTEVDFGFNDQGQLTVDLHDGGPVQVYNDPAGFNLNLNGKNSITVKFDKAKGELVVTNSCDSSGAVTFSILGKEYSVDKCGSQTVATQTAAGPNNPPNTNQDTKGSENNPNEDTPSPSSPV